MMKKILLTGSFALLFFGFHAFCQPCPPPGFPVPGDLCPQAPVLCVDIDGYCDSLDGNNINQTFPGCPANALNNDEWFAFIAGSTTISLQVVMSNCEGTNGQFGMQGAIYEGSCTGPAVATQCNCVTAPFTLTYTNFQPGQVYYVVFDGCSGDICDYVVNVIQGSTLPAPPAMPQVPPGPFTACPGATTEYEVGNPNAATFDWTMDPPGYGSISGSPGPSVSVNWTGNPPPGGVDVEICVTSSNPCEQGPEACFTVHYETLEPEEQEYVVCLGDCIECAGQTFCAATPPTGIPVTLQNYLGCDSVIVCKVSTVYVPDNVLPAETYCYPASVVICGQVLNQTGYHNVECTNWQGCDSNVVLDLAILDPVAIISPPGVLPCGANAILQLDGINSTQATAPGATTIYEWTGPGIVGPNNDVTVIVDEPGQYCLTVTHARDGIECSDQVCVNVTQNNAVPNAPTVSGNQNPCQGSQVTYTVTPGGGPAPTSYTVTAPAGATVTMLTLTTYQVTWGATGGNLCVTANNGCGSSPQTCIPITIQPLPNTPTVTGTAAVCANNTLVTFSVSNVQAGVTYNWTVPAGASITGSGSSIQVNFSGAAAGAGQVCATAQNACGMSQPGCFNVTVTAPPSTPSMSGPATVCNTGGNYTYTVSSPQAGVTFNWTAPAGATITGSGASVQVNFSGATSGQVCVSATNACGTSSQTCQPVTVNIAPTATISGSGAICQGANTPVNLSISLTGNSPWDVVYSNGSNNTPINGITSSPYTLTVNAPGTYTLVSVTGALGCAGTVSGSAVVQQNPAPTAALSGSGSICANSGQCAPLTVTLTGTAPWVVNWTVNGATQAPLNVPASPFTLNICEAQAGTVVLTGVTDGNGCTGTASGSVDVTVDDAPVVSNIQTTCNATSTAYTVTFTISGGEPASYSVTPLNGTLTGGNFTSDPIPSGTGYSFVVTDANNCNPVTVSQANVLCNCLTDVGTMDQTPVEECGDGPVMVNYNAQGENLDGNDVVQYILHSGSGLSVLAPIVATSNTPSVSFNPATMTYGTTYYFSAVVGDNDGSGGVDLNDPCLAVAQGTPVTFYEIPTATLSGTPSICEGDQIAVNVDFTGVGPWGITYNDGSGDQTLNGITSDPYDLMVNPSATSTYTLVAVSDVNCDGTVSGSAMVTVNTGVQIMNVATTCNATSTAYTVTFDITGGDPASYAVTGAQGSISPTAPYIFTSNPISTGVGYSITVDDANSCDPQTTEMSIVVCNCTTDAGDMDTTPLEECGDGPVSANDATNTTLDGDDILIYALHTGSSNTLGTVLATNTTPSFGFDDGSMSYGTTYYISSVAGNNDGSNGVDLTDPCMKVAPGTPVTFREIPTASISGTTEICPGESADLTIDLTGDSPWTLTINGSPVSGINGTPYTYTVNPAATTTYDLTVVADEHCSNSVSSSATVTVHDPPTVSNIDAVCNGTGTAFTVCFDINGGDPAGYTVTPATGTLTGNQFCSDPIPAGQGYNFQVTDGHGCPAAVAQQNMVDCNCLSEAGDMDATPIKVCGSTPAVGTYLGGETLDADDVLCFMLHNGNNVPIATTSTNPPSFTYSAGNMSYGTTYYISAIVGNDNGSGCVALNDPCKNIGAGQEVVFNAIPTATLSGGGNICTGESSSLTFMLTGVGPWTVEYMNANGQMFTQTFNTSPGSVSVNPSASTVYTVESVTDANCDGTVNGVATVSVNQPPQAINATVTCDPTGTNYVVTFSIIGGDPGSYVVTPAGSGTISAGVFTSNPIPTGQSYNFQVDDGNGCGPNAVSGVKECDCLTDAGDMTTTLMQFCIGETATVPATTNPFLDPDDELVYILHTNNGNTLGTVIATSPTPSFTFLVGQMSPGIQYYISAVAGDGLPNGNVNLTDGCLSVAPGTPVIFFPLPTLNISGTTDLCAGQSADVTVSVTGTGPFEVVYLANGVLQPILPIPTPGSVTLAVQPNMTTTYTLVSITDVASGCENTSTQSATITVNQPVEAGTAIGDLEFCDEEDPVIDLNAQLTGSQPGGQWTQNGSSVSGGSVNASTLAPGTYTYLYTMDAVAPCADDQATFQVTIHPQPVADAGTDQELNCDVLEVAIGGSGSTPGATYTWTGGNVNDPSLPTTSVVDSGLYTLTVSTAFGCTDSDVVQVEKLITVPEPHMTISDVSCFGLSDGFLLIDSITNGEPPYLCSVNGSPFSTTKQFTNLGAGEHTIIIEDGAGCERTILFSVAEPEEVQVEIQGAFEGDDPIVNLGESVVLQLITTPPANQLDTILWTPANADTTCVICDAITISPTEQTTYSVTVSKDGCTDKDVLTVFVKKDHPLFVPNAFSPNEDGRNDVFNVTGNPRIREVKKFLVFNRWGEIVYEYYNFVPESIPTFGWDGWFRGKPLDPAVFTWFAEVEFIDDAVEIFEGDVTLVK